MTRVSRTEATDSRRRRHLMSVWQQRQRLRRVPAMRYARTCALLAQLAGKIECNDFSADELNDARASLLQTHDPKQGVLDLRSERRNG